jgi:hypothetical protein
MSTNKSYRDSASHISQSTAGLTPALKTLTLKSRSRAGITTGRLLCRVIFSLCLAASNGKPWPMKLRIALFAGWQMSIAVYLMLRMVLFCR